MQIEPYNRPAAPIVQPPQPLALNYYASQTDHRDELSFRQILSIIRRRILVIAGVAVAVTGSIWAWTLTRPSIYQSGFQVLIEPAINLNRPQEFLLFGPQSSFDYATQIEVMRSPEMLAPTVKALQRIYPGFSHGELIAGLSISQTLDPDQRPTKILMISYQDQDPEKVKRVLDQLAADYLQYSINLRQVSLQQGVKFVEERLPELRRRVNQLQRALADFRQQYSLLDPESRGAQISGQLNSIETQQQDTEVQLKQAETLYATLQQQVGQRDPAAAIAATSLSESSRYQSLLNQIQQIESQIATESVRFQPSSPNIQALVEKRERLLPLLQQEGLRVLGRNRPAGANGNLTAITLDLNKQLVNTANQIEVLRRRSIVLAETEARLKREFDLVPALARRYTDLQRELKVATDSLNRFLSTREDLQIEASQRALPWQIIVPPVKPSVPISPNVPRNLGVGVAAGLVLGFGAALLAEKLDNVFHTANELKDSTRLPLLGIIPYQKALPKVAVSMQPRLRDSEGQWMAAQTGQSIAVEQAPGADSERRDAYTPSPFTDAFRTVYANLRFLGSDAPVQSIVIGSAVPGDGKSTVAVNLAHAAAAMGQRVLLVDADLRRPQVHSIMGVPNIRGLSNLLFSDLGVE
ncbi:MAG: exopolysaccharide transport family protein, partial [Cyanobacteria bacterium]|nr:exopolysaccharide transport family protein [Cyanobacteriota bacterium]MDW8202729.1 exopolysaccharide transport family protein [Cyanobacteriota bacterium SKYGB_h_bin112]